MLTKGAIGNLINRYKAVLKKCHIMNTFGSLAVASMLVLGGAGVAGAAEFDETACGSKILTDKDFTKLEAGYGVQLTITNDTSVTATAQQGRNAIYINSNYQNTNNKETDYTEFVINTHTFKAVASDKHAIEIEDDFCESKIQVTASNITIDAQDGKNAIHLRRGGVVELNASEGEVLIYGSTNSPAIDIAHSQLHINGDVTINAEKSGVAIFTRGGSIINIGQSGEKAKIIGDIAFNWTHHDSAYAADSIVNITLSGKDSYWIGNSRLDWLEEFWPTTDENLVVSNMKLNIEDGATWTPTASTDVVDVAEGREDTGSKKIAVSNISLDGGNINIPAGVDTIVKNVTGNGNINMENADTLGTFTADSATAATLQVRSMGNDGKIQTADDVTPEQLTAMWENVAAKNATVTALAEEGLVEGKITVSAAGDTVQAEKTPEPEVTPEQPKPETPEQEVTPEQPKPQVQQARNTLMDAALRQASVTTVALDKILTNDVRKRLGDIRSDKNTTGVWMRWDGGKLAGNGLSNDFNTIQIGGDTKVGKNCRLGVAGTFTHGDAEFARGTAELEGFTFAAYATWMGENGMFADVVARLGQFSNEMNVEGRKGDMDNRVFSLSGEYGWRLPVCDQFFIEPQVELAYTYVSSDDLELGTAKYAFDNVNSLTGRAGVVFGWNLPDDRGNVYARASVLQQFMGDAKITGTKGIAYNVQELDGNDTWIEYGIGANVKLTDKTYIWADVERTEGADIEEEWRGTVGIRYSF